ncbi:MAG: hypothetical protein IJ416_02650 [Ruminiclostridium sp.]|nr:hypothetical protein [Ruminiclostridium sp.]
MTTQTKDNIIAKISEAESIIKEYSAKTNEILNTDIDDTLEDILAERAGLLEKLDLVTSEIDEITAQFCDETERKYIENSLQNKHIPLGLSTEIKEIRRAAVKMHSFFTEAVEKDALASKRVDARVKELRAGLEDLREDKRKIDFYAHNKIGVKKGSSFNEKL